MDKSFLMKLVIGLLKFAWKLFLTLVWGCLHLIEVLLQQINKMLKKNLD